MKRYEVLLAVEPAKPVGFRGVATVDGRTVATTASAFDSQDGALAALAERVRFLTADAEEVL